MFQRPTGLRTTRASATSQNILNENQKPVANSKAGEKSFGPREVVTRKRRALVDVSNQIIADVATAVAEKKTAAVVEEKKAAAAPPSSNPTSSLRMRPTVVSRKPAATLTAKTSTAVPKLTTTTRPKPAPLSSNIPLKVTETTKSILIPTTKLDVNENRKKIDPKTKAPVAAAVNLRDEDVAEAGKENREIIVANNNSAVAVVAPKITAVPADGSHKRQKTCEILDTAEEHSWDDLDADDLDDPVMVSEYVVEIFEYLKVLEVKMMPDPDYMSQQKELQWRMRSILMDWLVEVHYKFKLLPETLFLTANIIDRFLSVKVVSLTKLQLVGITSMFIAAKYEEVFAPSISQFVFIADGGYTTEEIVKAERYVLSMLQFNLQYPNPLNFLRRCSKADNYDIQTRTLAKYLMEITLIDHVFLDIVPSLISSSGIFLARKILERSEWDANLEHYSGYTVDEMKPCVTLMIQQLSKERKFHAVYNKYASSKFLKASVYANDWLKRQDGRGVF